MPVAKSPGKEVVQQKKKPKTWIYPAGPAAACKHHGLPVDGFASLRAGGSDVAAAGSAVPAATLARNKLVQAEESPAQMRASPYCSAGGGRRSSQSMAKLRILSNEKKQFMNPDENCCRLKKNQRKNQIPK